MALDVVPNPGRSIFSQIILAFAVLMLSLIAVFGNSSVLTVICINEELNSQVSNLLIASLAITDMLCGIVVMFPSFIAVITEKWMLGAFFCNIHCGFNYGLLTLSLLNIMAINIDRVIAVTFPLHYSFIVTKPRLLIAIVILWIDSFAWGFFPIFAGWIGYDYWEINCGIEWAIFPKAMFWAWPAVICNFICPSVVISITCYIIIKNANKSNKNIQTISKADASQQGDGKKQAADNANRKLVTSLLILISFFVVCTAPYCFIRLAKLTTGNQDLTVPWLNTLSSVFVFVASTVNPFIYGIFRKDFNIAFMRLFKSVGRKIWPT